MCFKEKLLFFFIFLITILPISFSVSLISSEALNPSNGNKIFIDSQDVTVKFSFDGFEFGSNKYELVVGKPVSKAEWNFEHLFVIAKKK